MCRHCERLVEDVADKKIVHDFMESVASKVNRKINEDLEDALARSAPVDPETDKPLTYKHGSRLKRPVTADDIDMQAHVTAVFWHDNPFNGTKAQAEVYRMLQKMWE